MDFSPHKFHPRLYAHDPYDLLIFPNKHRARFIGECTCELKHSFHGEKCEARVERDSLPTKRNYTCYDCDREVRNERDRLRHRKSRHHE